MSAKKKIPIKFNVDDYIMPNLTREEIVCLKVHNNTFQACFDSMDEDHSGSISPNELKAAFERLGFKGNMRFVYQALAEFDDGDDGEINFHEFLILASFKLSEKNSKSEVQRVFNFYDKNKEGRITWDELKEIAADLGEEMTDEEVKEMFNRADRDEDGFVSFDDFYNIITGKVYWD